VNERADRRTRNPSLGELARLFLKLGTIGFGGPAAHIALMEDEVVRRRGWLTREAFLDYVGATNLIPGPNSTELAIEVGRDRAGWPGLLVAGASFIVPAALIVGVIAWGYVRYGQLPAMLALLAGVKPVVIAIVVQALWRLARTAIKTVWLAALAVGVIVAVVAGVHELLALLGAAVVATLGALRKRGDATRALGAGLPLGGAWPRAAPTVSTATSALGMAAIAPAVSLWPLFGIFLKIGSVLFGSGYVLLAFLRADFVQRLGWLTERQLLDAVAVGQVTPGPVFTTATFIGYVLGAVPGAIVATVGIFLPAFVFVALSGPLVPRLRKSPVAGAALDGVNAASFALMALVTWQLGRAAIVDVPTALLALGAGVLLAAWRINAAWLILGGGIVGVMLAAFRG
jgi:chromate transporter